MIENNIATPDLIISTLPNSVFEKYPELFDYIASLTSKGAIFRGITYAPHVFVEVYKYMSPTIIGHTWKNIPPLYVLGIN